MRIIVVFSESTSVSPTPSPSFLCGTEPGPPTNAEGLNREESGNGLSPHPPRSMGTQSEYIVHEPEPPAPPYPSSFVPPSTPLSSWKCPVGSVNEVGLLST